MLKKLLSIMAAATILTFLATMALLPFAVRSGIRYANEMAAYFDYETLIEKEPTTGISNVVVDTGDSYAQLWVHTVPEDSLTLTTRGFKTAEITPTLTTEGETLYLDLDFAVLEEFSGISEMVKKGMHSELELYLPAGVELEYSGGDTHFAGDRVWTAEHYRTELLGEDFEAYLALSPETLGKVRTPLELYAAGELSEEELRTRLDALHYDTRSNLRAEVNALASEGLRDWREELLSAGYEMETAVPPAAVDEDGVWAQVDAACIAAENYLNARREYLLASTQAWCKRHMGEEALNGRMPDLTPGSTEESLRTRRNTEEQRMLEARRALDNALMGGAIDAFPEDGGYELRAAFYERLCIRNPFSEGGYEQEHLGY